ncbi:protein kinase domain-containing protein [Tengunoibacter tsumagoiensis]|nr:protein kinase [Tengunoibacter tsumagoiensis]
MQQVLDPAQECGEVGVMKGIEGSKLGRYELRCRVAQGGMSEVYLGYDRRVRRWVAVKVLYGSDEPFVRRFEREALAIGALSHENILPLYDFGEQRPWYYLVMPYVEGGTLRDHLFKRERLTLEEAGSFLEQIASALQYAHDHGVIHRDVKPSNILLRPDGHAYLADFGLAKAKMDAESLVHSGALVGTPEYMAPEQSDGINDHRSDIYALGIILYQLLTGRVPFMADTPVAVMLKHLQSPPLSPRQLNAEIPQAIEDVMLKALAKRPEDRYQDARSFAQAYRKALHQELVSHLGIASRPANEQERPTIHDVDTLPGMVATIASAFDELPGKTPLFPVGYDTSFIPRATADYKKRSWSHPRTLILLGFVFLLIGASLGVFLFHHTTSIPKSTSKPRTPDLHTKVTETSIAHNALQATMAAEARVQATAGITSAVSTGPLLYYDDMQTSGGGWINDGKQCAFSSMGYQVRTYLPHSVAWCYSNQASFFDVAITAQAELLQGNFCGLVFRLDPHTKAFYVLELNSLGQYRFQRALGNDPSLWLTLIDWTSSSALNTGYGVINTLLVVTTNSTFRFYVNKQLIVSSFTDSTYRAGLLGLLVGEDNESSTQALFSQVAVFRK